MDRTQIGTKKTAARISPTAALGLGTSLVGVLVLGLLSASPRRQSAVHAYGTRQRTEAIATQPAPAAKAKEPLKDLFRPLVGAKTGEVVGAAARGVQPARASDGASLLPNAVVGRSGVTTAKGESKATGPEYVGTVTAGGTMVALLQDPRTGEGSFVRAGDDYFGNRVVRITDEDVTIQTAKGMVRLPKTSGTDPATKTKGKAAADAQATGADGQTTNVSGGQSTSQLRAGLQTNATSQQQTNTDATAAATPATTAAGAAQNSTGFPFGPMQGGPGGFFPGRFAPGGFGPGAGGPGFAPPDAG
ncbi:MAG TPA: hypothetical protein VGN26_06510 [Armatimonadota bacterium]|jgi:hypothetical protein